MIEQEQYTLANKVDEYLAMRQINKKKYFVGYMIIAKRVWRYLFQNTIYAVQSEWMSLKADAPYNYIDVQKRVSRIFSIAETDHCGNIVPLFYNSELNTIPKPLKSACGCGQCDCAGGFCDDINSLVKTTELLFTINGVDYYKTTWVKICPNGQVILYEQIPTKKFNSFTGDGGDYSSDYDNDYLINNPPFSDYTIVTETIQKVICNIELKPCGCPVDTPENKEKFFNTCGCFIRATNCCYGKHCEQSMEDTNSNCRGEVKISECGTKIYYKPHRDRNKYHTEKLPKFLLVNFQTSGEDCSSEVIIPNNEACLNAMDFGIDYYSKKFNNKFTPIEKGEAKNEWKNAQNELILYLNPLSLKWLSNVQDQIIRY